MALNLEDMFSQEGHASATEASRSQLSSSLLEPTWSDPVKMVEPQPSGHGSELSLGAEGMPLTNGLGPLVRLVPFRAEARPQDQKWGLAH